MPNNLVFVHGGGQGAWVWDQTIAALVALSEDVRYLALDVPGCGTKRDRDTASLDMGDIARELVAEIAESGMQSIVLVGHSQAGMLMPRMVECASATFERLVYVTCSAPPPGTSIMQLIGEGVQGERDDCVGWALDEKTTPMIELFREMFCTGMSADEQEAFLSKLLHDSWPPKTYTQADWRYEHLIAQPASYVVCGRDKSLPPDWQQRFAAQLGVERILHIDAGHQVMNTHPELLAELLLAECGL
ncbi:alpha/beta fold hydrolase [Mycobacterium sp. NPDC051804]|uniref:alpha/beta fold hydrolase n=1 Tax=Mycobacterium sp. NPDC051804 TaxID=3364295 RepID=UPI003790FC69